MKVKMSTVAAALAALGVAACGGTDGAEGASERAAASQAPREVRHAMGTTRVPADPQRVVVLDTGELDSAIALGVEPVGAVEAIAGEGFPDYLGERIEGVEKVGTIEQPNLEAIAALRPELILSSKIRHESIYDELSRIAPTVFTEEVGVTWKDNFDLHARALGRTDDARRLSEDYRQKVAELRGALESPPAVSVVRSVGDEVRIYQNANFLGTILQDAGLPRPDAQDEDAFSETATRERIADLDGDVMFLSRFGDDHRLLERLMESPLWDRLDVVRQDRVYEVPDDLWFLGIGNLAARKIVDDLRTILVDGERLAVDDGDPATA